MLFFQKLILIYIQIQKYRKDDNIESCTPIIDENISKSGESLNHVFNINFNKCVFIKNSK